MSPANHYQAVTTGLGLGPTGGRDSILDNVRIFPYTSLGFSFLRLIRFHNTYLSICQAYSAKNKNSKNPVKIRRNVKLCNSVWYLLLSYLHILCYQISFSISQVCLLTEKYIKLSGLRLRFPQHFSYYTYFILRDDMIKC